MNTKNISQLFLLSRYFWLKYCLVKSNIFFFLIKFRVTPKMKKKGNIVPNVIMMYRLPDYLGQNVRPRPRLQRRRPRIDRSIPSARNFTCGQVCNRESFLVLFRHPASRLWPKKLRHLSMMLHRMCHPTSKQSPPVARPRRVIHQLLKV